MEDRRPDHLNHRATVGACPQAPTEFLSSYSRPYFYFLVAVPDDSVLGDDVPGIVGCGLSIPFLASDCPLMEPSPGVVGRDPVLPLSTCPGLGVPGLLVSVLGSLPVLGRSGCAPMFPVPVLVFPGPAGPVPVCPLGPVPEICASTRGAAAKSTARAPARALPSLRNICIFSWSNIGYASLLASTPVHARLGRATRVYAASQEISCAGGSNSYASCRVGALCSLAGADSGVAVGPLRRLQ
jgi:hypothetical protein